MIRSKPHLPVCGPIRACTRAKFDGYALERFRCFSAVRMVLKVLRVRFWRVEDFLMSAVLSGGRMRERVLRPVRARAREGLSVMWRIGFENNQRNQIVLQCKVQGKGQGTFGTNTRTRARENRFRCGIMFSETQFNQKKQGGFSGGLSGASQA
ncbi:hypothetical protein VXQ18_07130 [Brucella abortus]|nr:hypothetical protein [Brucella abortus]